MFSHENANINSIFSESIISTDIDKKENSIKPIEDEIHTINNKIIKILEKIIIIDDINNPEYIKLYNKVNILKQKITILIEQEKNKMQTIEKQIKYIECENFKNKYRAFNENKNIFNKLKENNNSIPNHFKYIYSIYDTLYKMYNFEKTYNNIPENIDDLTEKQKKEYEKFIELFNSNLSNLTEENLFTIFVNN